VPVRAAIRGLANYSAHADHSELMRWIKERLPAHGALFLTHGDDEERAALRAAVIAEHGLGGDQVVLPQLDDAFELRAEGVAGVERPERRRIDPAQMTSDWHNAYASFIIDLSQRLQEADDDATRLKLVTALKSELAAARPVVGRSPEAGEQAEPGGE
jgi:metallo-beta-lactamase family protein